MKPFWKRLVGVAIVVPVLVLGFLLATGERGLLSSGRSKIRIHFEPRDVATFQLTGPETERLGWSPERLGVMLDYLSRLSTDAFVIVTKGETVASLGPLDTVYNVHSVRKAMLNAVVGQHLGDGPTDVSLDATLEQFGIDDEPGPLTPLQRQATVLHLVRSVSGINHPAAAEGGLTADKDARLGHEENQPGAVWAYNNWDYNALTTIFEQRTGLTVADAFRSGIADPLGFQDVSGETVTYSVEPERSRHRAAAFRLSARDLVRFGQLYLDRGVADGEGRSDHDRPRADRNLRTAQRPRLSLVDTGAGYRPARRELLRLGPRPADGLRHSCLGHRHRPPVGYDGLHQALAAASAGGR